MPSVEAPVRASARAATAPAAAVRSWVIQARSSSTASGSPSRALKIMITPLIDGLGGSRRVFSGKVEATFTRQKSNGSTCPVLMCRAPLLRCGISRCWTGGMFACPRE